MRRTLALAISAAVAAILLIVAIAAEPASSPTSVKAGAEPTSTTTTDPGPTDAEIEAWATTYDVHRLNEALWVHRTNEKLWIDRTNEILAAEQAARDAAEAQRRSEAAERAERAAPAPQAPSGGGGRIIGGIEVCNGVDLPTCAIVQRESGFDPTAENPTSTASGLFQFLDSTFAACGTGYSHASYAPVSVQVACARQIWANGAGRSHWQLTA